MSTAHHRALQLVSQRRSCLDLGICQSRTPGCPGCTCHQDSGYHTPHLDDEPESISPMERIAYWACVGATAGMSLVLVAGTAGHWP